MDAPAPIPYEEALQRLRTAALAHAAAVATETIALGASAGRVLANALHADRQLPPFANAAMDGFACRGADLADAGVAGLRLAGERFAGVSAALRCGPGECVRITTGAVLPEGADTVVPQESAQEHANGRVVFAAARAGCNVRGAGEDIAVGDTAIEAGAVLTPARIGLLAALGIAHVQVRRQPSVALLVSGDELRSPGEALENGEIHDSNSTMLSQLLASEGIAASGAPRLPDRLEAIAGALSAAALAHDLVITCGGASVGLHDFLPRLLAANTAALGEGRLVNPARLHFWRVRIKPGMPVLCATLGRALLIGLPGNPVSAFCAFHAFVRPALDVLQGRMEARQLLHARLEQPLRKRHSRHELRRGTVRCSPDGVLSVSLHPRQGSHQLSGVAMSNALVHVRAECTELAAGDCVAVEPYGAILGT